MRMRIRVGLVLVLATMLVVGSISAAATTIRITARPDEGRITEYYSSLFTEATGINVEIDYIGWDILYEKSVTTIMAGGQPYDVMIVPGGVAGPMMASGKLLPLNGLISEAELAKFTPALLNNYSQEGVRLGVPWYAGGSHMLYNGAYLAQAGVAPEEIVTWEDFLDACRKIKQATDLEYVYAPSAGTYVSNWIYGFGTALLGRGGLFVDDESNILINSDIAVETLDLFVQGIQEGLFDPNGIAMDDHDSMIAFEAGKVAFHLGATFQASALPELHPDYEIGVMLNPGSAGNRSGSNLYSAGWGIPASSQNKEAALQYILFMTDVECQLMHAMLGWNLPVRTRLYSEPYSIAVNKAWAIYSVLAEQMEYGYVDPMFVSWYTPALRELMIGVQDALALRKTPREALDWVMQRTTDLKDEAES